MRNEIVFEKLPSGRVYAKRLVQLRSFIENKLLTQPDSIWDFDSEDPTWQAVCHYYSLIIRAHTKTDPAVSHLGPAIKTISSGAIIDGLEYPTIWHNCFRSERLATPSIAFAAGCESLSPSIVIQMIGESVKAHGFPQSSRRNSLGREGLKRHLENTTPGERLQLTTRMDAWANTTLCLYDGQFISGLSATKEMPAGNWIDGEDIQTELFARWLRDSVLGIGLRDIIGAEGGIVVKAVEQMSELLQHRPLTSETVYLVLSAVAGRIWGREMLQPLTAALLTEEHDNPTRIYCLINELPKKLIKLLSPEILAYRL